MTKFGHLPFPWRYTHHLNSATGLYDRNWWYRGPLNKLHIWWLKRATRRYSQRLARHP